MTTMTAQEEAAAPRVRATLRAVFSNPVLAVGVTLIAGLLTAAVLAPWIAPYPGDAKSNTDTSSLLLAPSSEHFFGTDQYGRDIFSRVLFGARISLLTAFGAIALAVAIGLPLGLCAGYFGGKVDEMIMRITDIFLAVPALLLALAFATVISAGLVGTLIAVGISQWPWYARLARGQAASVAGRPYIEACRTAGLGHRRIVFRHILPNATTPVIVHMSLEVGSTILLLAGLAYLGLGAQDPLPDWGVMVSQGQAYFTTNYWVAIFPGAAILVAAVAFNLLGDGLRDVLDPKDTGGTRA